MTTAVAEWRSGAWIVQWRAPHPEDAVLGSLIVLRPDGRRERLEGMPVGDGAWQAPLVLDAFGRWILLLLAEPGSRQVVRSEFRLGPRGPGDKRDLPLGFIRLRGPDGEELGSAKYLIPLGGVLSGVQDIAEPRLLSRQADPGWQGGGLRVSGEAGSSAARFVTRGDLGRSRAALVNRPEERLAAIIHNGQSLAAGGGGSHLPVGQRAVSLEPPDPHYALMFRGGTLTRPFETIPPSELSDLEPCREDPSLGESQGTGLLRLLLSLFRGEGRTSPTLVYRSVAVGGQRIDQLVRGSVPFANLLATAEAASRLARIYGRPGAWIPACPWTQGEADRKARTGRAEYRGMLQGYAQDAEAAIRAITGQCEPVWITVDQLMAAGNGVSASRVALAQFDASEDESLRMLLVAPKYFLRPPFGLLGNVHLAPLAYAILGEYHAKAIAQIMGNPEVRPETCLRPRRAEVRRHGRHITIPLRGAVGEVGIDDVSVPLRDGAGFAHPAGISEIFVEGEAVRLTLQSDRTGRLTYAYEGPAQDSDEGCPGDWGNIRDSDGTESLAVPGMRLFNWLVTFDIEGI